MQTGADTTPISELLVLWQKPENRAMVPIATLSFDSREYKFEYLAAARSDKTFRPLLGFRDLQKSYTSDELFPLFHERVMDPARDDFARVVEDLNLRAADATPWEQLVRSGGGSEGDTLHLTPVPFKTEDGWACHALLAGLRYFQAKRVRTVDGQTAMYTPEGFERVLQTLHVGDELFLKKELGNDYNSDAVLLYTDDGAVVGYLPDWLARFVGPEMGEHTLTARVDRVNPSQAGWHLRLLVTLESDEPFEVASARLRSGPALTY